MADPLDFFNEYIMGSVQMLFGFYLFARLSDKRVRFYFYMVFALCAAIVLYLTPTGSAAGMGVFFILLMTAGIALLRTGWRFSFLYAALVVIIMQLSYGVINSVLSISYQSMSGSDRDLIGIIFMMSGNLASLLLTGVCCYIVHRYFSNELSILHSKGMEKQYMLPVLIPILMIFVTEEYINSFIYGMVVTDLSGVGMDVNHYRVLAVQILVMASLFCILFAYNKLLGNFRLSTELSLLEQEEHSLWKYVDEAKSRYEKTKSFRHDIKNHITVIKELLQNNNPEQALQYISDMEDMAEGFSFPCNTNNPVVDILVGNKLGIAKNMGIDVRCSLYLPYPCGLRDIDICIILSNALDNALRACKEADPDVLRYISVSGRIQGDFVFICIENSFQGSGDFRKGTGMSNIEAVALKYNGAVDIKISGSVFVLNVLLIIPQCKENISG